ncbi:MAG: hypothetical protein WBD36_15410 [Bacteroidota bacterium]
MVFYVVVLLLTSPFIDISSGYQEHHGSNLRVRGKLPNGKKASTIKAVFVESRPIGVPKMGVQSTDIVVVDLEAGTTNTLTNDDFFDCNPAWSSDGSKIVFASAREGDPLRARALGSHMRKSLYSFDLSNNEIKRFVDVGALSPQIDFREFVGLGFSQKRSELFFFSNKDNHIYAFDSESRALVLNKEIAGVFEILDLSVSHDGKEVAFTFEKGELMFGVGLFDVPANSTEVITENSSFVTLGGWLERDSAFVFEDSLPRIYNVYSKSSIPVDLNDVNKNVVVKNVNILAGDKILFLAARKKIDPSYGNTVDAFELAVYDRRNQKMEWITNSGRNKSSLKILSTKAKPTQHR